MKIAAQKESHQASVERTLGGLRHLNRGARKATAAGYSKRESLKTVKMLLLFFKEKKCRTLCPERVLQDILPVILEATKFILPCIRLISGRR